MNTRFYRSILMAATAATTLFSAGSALAQDRLKSDFNNDGKADILWRNRSTDTTVVWYMNGPTMIGNQPFLWAPGGPDWDISAVGDFDNNGLPDFILRHPVTGGNKVYFGGGNSNVLHVEFLPDFTDLGWKIAGAGNFSPTGNNDSIVWRNYSTGQNIVWDLSDSTYRYASTYTLPSQPDTNWILAGVGDFDNNGISDLVWHNKNTGENILWLMQTGNLLNSEVARILSVKPLHASAPAMIPEAVADYTGDRCDDIILRNDSTGYVELWAYDCNLNRVSVSAVATADTAWNIGVH